VLVVGSGSAGLTAAVTAVDLGADVLVLEVAEEAGGSSDYGGFFFGAGTDLQAEMGVEDTPEDAIAGWEEITGAEPDDRVEAFIRDTADTMRWIEARSGVAFDALSGGEDLGATRSHAIGGGQIKEVFLDILGSDVRTGVLVESLVTADGAVVGARAREVDSERLFWVRAGAVVMATGGYARDRVRLDADRPALAGLTVLPEAAPVVLGLGHPVLEAVGAGWQNQGRYGLYVHGTPDVREGLEDESLLVGGLPFGLAVDTEAQRFLDESAFGSLATADRVLTRPGRRVFVLFGQERFSTISAEPPRYTWSGDVPDTFSTDDLVAAGQAWRAASLPALAGAMGLDASALQATVDRYEAGIPKGDPDFHKQPLYLESLGDAGYGALEVHVVAAKAFTGVATGDDAGVLDAGGAPIPGLYAAGEVTGMLGTPAVGRGFAGSMTAIHWLARIAGEEAARYAGVGGTSR